MTQASENRLGIELLSTFGMPPVELAVLVSELGCRNLSIGLTHLPMNPCGYPAWSLRADASLRRSFIAAMRKSGVRVSLGEGFIVRPGSSVLDMAGDMDLMAELGAPALGTVSLEPDSARYLDELTLLAEMAADRGLAVHLEFVPGLVISDLTSALAVVEQVGKPNLHVMVDVMHFFHSGGTIAQLDQVDMNRIGYVQLCDASLTTTHSDYMNEAMTARFLPGEGEMPLADFIRLLPQDIPIGLEIPNLAATAEPDWPLSWLQKAVARARQLGA